jgi:hypothetical protein
MDGVVAFCYKGKQNGVAKLRMRVHGLVCDAITVVVRYRLENDAPLYDVKIFYF